MIGEAGTCIEVERGGSGVGERCETVGDNVVRNREKGLLTILESLVLDQSAVGDKP